MAIRDRLIDLEQRLKRLAGEDGPREPLEIRQAVIQAVVDATQPTGRGRRVLPFDRADVDVVAATPEARRVMEAVLERDAGLEASLRQALEAVGCSPATSFGVDVHYRKRPPAGWAPGRAFAVTGRSTTPGPETPDTSACGRLHAPAVRAALRAGGARGGGAPGEAAPQQGSASETVVLRVLKGKAARRTVELLAERLNVGRSEEVVDRDGHLVRRNDLAFLPGDAAGDTVSRAHAHIRRAASGEYRVRDEGSVHGTRIVRVGRTIDVAPGNTRGVRLQDGDELHFGQAVVRVTVAGPGA